MLPHLQVSVLPGPVERVQVWQQASEWEMYLGPAVPELVEQVRVWQMVLEQALARVPVSPEPVVQMPVWQPLELEEV